MHLGWKIHLKTAIAVGTSEFKPETVEKDSACEFGKWLYSLAPFERQLPAIEMVIELHAQFHREAARILDLAVNGHPLEAEKLLSSDGDFAGLSSQLVKSLQKLATD